MVFRNVSRFSLLSFLHPSTTASCTIVLNSAKIHSPLLAQCKSRQESPQEKRPLGSGLSFSPPLLQLVTEASYSASGLMRVRHLHRHGTVQYSSRPFFSCNERLIDLRELIAIVDEETGLMAMICGVMRCGMEGGG